eukprot:gene17052-20314_t
MIVQPFTKSGIDAKQKELYLLAAPEQRKQTEEIRSSFKTWMLSNFKLDGKQTGFVNNMPPQVVQSICHEIADSIERKIPLEIELPDIPIGSKFMAKESGLKYTYNDNGAYEVSGRLHIRFVYK